MEFCNYCQNMYYIKEVEENDSKSIMYYCKNCGSTKSITDGDTKSKLIMSHSYEDMNEKYIQFLNPNIQHDHTIPHVSNVTCQSESCTKQKEDKNDVMYIKYDELKIKYVYCCAYCKFFWT